MNDFWKNKKVVVTGAAGFIGSHGVRALVEKGAKVRAIVSPKTTKTKLESIFGKSYKQISFIQADLLQPKECVKITKKQDIVLNFAAVDGGSRFKSDHSAEIFSANTRIVLNMLDASVANKIERFLLMSSVEVYPKNAKKPIQENTSWDFLDEANGYAWSKRFSETIAKMYAENFGLKIAIARPGNVYGPGDITGVKKERVIPTFINKVQKKEKIMLFDGGQQKKQFLYVDDCVEALLTLTEKYADCDAVNIAGGEIVTIKQLSEIIKSLIFNPTLKTIHLPIKKSERTISITKLEKLIGFVPKVTLIDGLRQTIAALV